MLGRSPLLLKLINKTSYIVILILLLAACSGNTTGSLSEQSDESLYIPPTAITAVYQVTTPTEVAASSETPQLIKKPATPTPSCTHNLRFMEDLTIPDGTVVSPGAILDKRWQVENTGTCNWDEDYRLRLITGLDLGATPVQALYPARSGTAATIRITFTAPIETGNYQSAWQAFSPQGEPFGDPFYIDIVVEAQDTSS
ncbi:MAG: NBR1-Ig-like domain-containing protein [Anaerolineales bacterium]|jgi:hypothetical protein